MRGIVLAAGRGSRLRQLTVDRPKCLVELAGRPLLQWQLEAMRHAGVDRILVVRGYKGERVHGDFEVRDNPRWNETHMVASLMCAEDWLAEEPCIVSYADIVYGAAAVSALARDRGDLGILYDTQWESLWRQRFDDPLADAESFKIDGQGRVLEIGRKGVTSADIQGQYMGLLKFTPASLAWIHGVLRDDASMRDRLDMTSFLARLIHRGHAVTGVPWGGPWCEVDSERDLAVAEALVASGVLSSNG